MNRLAKGLIKVFLFDYSKFIHSKLKNGFKLDLEFVVSQAVEEEREILIKKVEESLDSNFYAHKHMSLEGQAVSVDRLKQMIFNDIKGETK